MARVKLTEHKAKTLLFKELNLPYYGFSVKSQEKGAVKKLPDNKFYVVKVDQGIKKRMKQGLIKLRVKREEIRDAIHEFEKKGYERFIIEEMVSYDRSNEKYIALERIREGIAVTYSNRGGIDIENHSHKISRQLLSYEIPNSKSQITNKLQITKYKILKIAQELRVDGEFIERLREFCEKYYVSFLEINPLVVINHKSQITNNKQITDSKSQTKKTEIYILDLAVEVDSTAEFFVKAELAQLRSDHDRNYAGWDEKDVVGEQYKSEEEQRVQQLNKKSQAALSLTLLNPNGSLWVLLSGGGASITLADEVYNLGFGKELGNYGEYSGNPNADETYYYTKEVLSLMMKSNRRRLMLIIGGGVANFTDVRITFKGIIKALEEDKEKLKKKQVKIFVRRGGPHQKEGLQAIEEWLKKNKMYGAVSGPKLPLHEIVRMAITELK